jgi:hypothetical protein
MEGGAKMQVTFMAKKGKTDLVPRFSRGEILD